MRPYKITQKFSDRERKRPVGETRKPSKNVKIGKGVLLLWLLPLTVSGYLVYNSSNFIFTKKTDKMAGREEMKRVLTEGLRARASNEPHHQHVNASPPSKKNQLQNILEDESVKSKDDKEKVKFEVKDKYKEFDKLLEDISEEPIDKEEKTKVDKGTKVIPLYYVKLKGNRAKLYPAKRVVTKDLSLDKILKLLFNGPAPDEKSLGLKHYIPSKTKLLGYKIVGKRLYLNLNDEFLYTNPIITRLKVAQVVATVVSQKVHDLKEVVFLINNKKVNYLDNEGLVPNKVMTLNNTLKTSQQTKRTKREIKKAEPKEIPEKKKNKKYSVYPEDNFPIPSEG